MQLTGTLKIMLPLQKGMGRNGEWKKQDIVIETLDTYPKKICISIWGDKINNAILQPGNQLDIQFDIESREFNGKWYTDLKAWKIELAKTDETAARVQPADASAPSPQPPQAYSTQEPPAHFDEVPVDDLPF